MFKTGIAFLFGAFTHLIIIYIFGGYLYMKRLEVGGGVEGSIANQVPSILYIVFCIELLISIVLIGIGIYEKKEKWTKKREVILVLHLRYSGAFVV